MVQMVESFSPTISGEPLLWSEYYKKWKFMKINTNVDETSEQTINKLEF